MAVCTSRSCVYTYTDVTSVLGDSETERAESYWLTVQGIRSIVVAMVAWSMVLRACTSNAELREEAITLTQMLGKL